MDWISVKDRLPTKTGWYTVKTRYDLSISIPYSRNMKGELVWVIPDQSLIIHWK